MDMSKIQRALGMIEGVCVGLADKPAEIIECAVNEIDCELESGGVTAEMQNHTSGYDSDDVCINQCGDSIDQLISRLIRHRHDYTEGRFRDADKVIADFDDAAAEIMRMRAVIQDLEYRICMEQP